MNAPAPKVNRLKLIYQLTGQEPAEVVVHNRSLIAWDESRGKRKWPTTQEAPSLWATFILWHHLNRTGQYPGDFNRFQDECEAVDVDDDEVPVDPTQPTAGSDSSSESE